jgi:uncharacterized Zn finger protein
VSPRESAQDKGVRYLASGRLVVLEAAPGLFRAVVRGSAELHEVRFGRGGWSCTCLARTTCSHLHAARLVSAPDAARLIAPRKDQS